MNFSTSAQNKNRPSRRCGFCVEEHLIHFIMLKPTEFSVGFFF